MKATKEEVTAIFPIYFIDDKPVCQLDSQTKCKFLVDHGYDYYCDLHNENLSIDSTGFIRSRKDCLMATLFEEKGK